MFIQALWDPCFVGLSQSSESSLVSPASRSIKDPLYEKVSQIMKTGISLMFLAQSLHKKFLTNFSDA